MKFSNYIILSLCFHLLFFGIMGSINPDSREQERVFNVDIVEADPPMPAVMKKSKPVLKKRHAPKLRRRPLAKKPPDRMRDVSPASPSGNGGDTTAVVPPKNGKGFAPDEAPSYLFDREVIEKYASKIPRPEKGVTFDSSEFKNRGYMRMLKDKIESIWKYPKEAAKKGMSGDLYIMFTIKKNGDLGDIEILRTSGHRTLDRAAVRALTSAEPFWPLPDDWPQESLEVKGHFIYLYGRTHLR